MYEPGHFYTLYDEIIQEIPFPHIRPMHITTQLHPTYFQESIRDSICNRSEIISKRDKILFKNILIYFPICRLFTFVKKL